MAKLRPQLLGKARQKIFLFLLILIFSGPSFQSLTGEEGVSPFTPLPSSASINSEEQNVDDFAVHPASGRWNTTDDELTDDRIVDDNLRLITVDNTTSDTPGFQMNRDLRKTDGKVEWRSKADGSGNQTEYFRDIIGDSMDFEEGDVEELGSANPISTSDGLVIFASDADFRGFNYVFRAGFEPNFNLMNTVKFRIKSNKTGLMQFLFRFQTPGTRTINFDTTTEWQTFTLNLSDFTEANGPESLSERFDLETRIAHSDYPIGFEMEFLEITMDLDFATHIGQIEDTWDWEDSLEYFTDVEGNISDFNDGTTENYTTYLGATVTNDGSGFLKVEDTADGGMQRSGLSIDASVYKWFTMEFISNVSIFTIKPFDGSDNQVHPAFSSFAADTFHLISGDLSADPDWTGTETGFKVSFGSTGGVPFEVLINFTFIYDVELGDLESWKDVSLNYLYVNPSIGTLESPLFDSTAGNQVFEVDSALTIDTNRFEILTMRILTPEILIFRFEDLTTTDIFGVITTAASASFQVLSLDLSLDSDWTGIVTDVFRIRVFDFTGNFEGDERFSIDYMLLSGSWDEVDSTIGLYDDNSIGPLLNVSTHIFSDTSIGARFEVELLDLSGEIAYQFISNNFTDLTDLWVRGKITYDALRSSLIVEVKSDNLTRIFKATFPVDFTEISGRIPALFQLERMPAVFISTFTPAISWQELTIGNILAPFKEREWQHVTVPSDSDFLSDSWIAALVENNITSDQSKWRLNVPKLDSVSGLMIAFQEDDVSEFQDNLHYRFTLYGVDGDDGDLHKIAGIEIEFLDNNDPGGDALNSFVYIEDGNSNEIYEHSDNQAIDGVNVQFSIGLSRDRSEGNIRIKSDIDTTVADDSEIGSDNFTVSDWVTDPSQEFVLEVDYDIEAWGGATQIRYALEGFELKERDIFADIVNAIIEPVGNFLTDLLIAVFRFIAGIFKFIGDLIALAVSALEPFLIVISVAIAAIATDILAGLGSALDFISTAIAEIASDVATAFLAIVDDIISVLITLASSIMDILATIIPLLLTFLGTILIDLVDFIADVVFFWWEAMALPDILAIVELALDFLTELVDWLIITIAEIIQFALDVSWIILVVWWFICIPVQFGSAKFEPMGGIANAIEFFFGNALPISILGTSIYLPQGLVATAWLIILLPADFAIFTALA